MLQPEARPIAACSSPNFSSAASPLRYDSSSLPKLVSDLHVGPLREPSPRANFGLSGTYSDQYETRCFCDSKNCENQRVPESSRPQV